MEEETETVSELADKLAETTHMSRASIGFMTRPIFTVQPLNTLAEEEFDAQAYCEANGGTWNSDTNTCKYEFDYSEQIRVCEENKGTWNDVAKQCDYEYEDLKSSSQKACEANGGTWDSQLGTCMGGEVETGEIDDIQNNDKSNSQIACVVNGGTWDALTSTCINSDPWEKIDTEEKCTLAGGIWDGTACRVDNSIDSSIEVEPGKTPSQIACEAEGGIWDNETGTCSLEFEPSWDETPVFISESAFNFTPNLTWIVVGEFNWYRFDNAYIIDSNNTVLYQDGYRDGNLWWNPQALNPQTGKDGYWELGEDKPAVLEMPIVLNHLTDDEDPIDPGIENPNEELPNETVQIPEGTLIEVIRTDAKGHAVTQFDYPEGLYYVKELKAPEGYLTSNEKYYVELKYQDLNDEPVMDVYVNKGESIINYAKENHPLRVEILKVDGNNMKPLAKAEFQLWDHERTTVLETLVTDANGKAITQGLYDANEYSGYLWLKETKAPEGYEIIGDGWTKVEIDKTMDGYTTKVVVENYKPEEPEKPNKPEEPGNPSYDSLRVRLLKQMEGNILDAWKDVEFGIFAAEDIYSGSKRNPKLVYEKDEMLTSGHIDENGIFNVLLSEKEFKLADGKYYVQEIATNNHYVLDGTKWHFDYNRERDGSHAIVRINDMKPIINELKEVGTVIRVEKVDKQDYSKKLVGAKFILVKDQTDLNGDGLCNELDAIETQVSNESGYATFNSVESGTYWIKEVEAPVGYTLNPYWRKVVITDDGMFVSAEVSGTGIETEVIKSEDNMVTIVWTNAPKQITEGVDVNPTLSVGLLAISGLAIVILLVLKKREAE